MKALHLVSINHSSVMIALRARISTRTPMQNTFAKRIARVFGLLLLVAGVCASSAAPLAYISNSNANSVSVIDTATGTTTATVAVGGAPRGVAVNPATSRAYVVNGSSNTVSVINTTTNAVVATVNVGANPVGIAINPAGTKLYVANYDASTVSVINTSNNTVAATIAVGPYPYGVNVNPAGTRVYVSSASNQGISVINASNNTVLTTIAQAGNADLVGNAAGTRLYSGTTGGISVVDTTANVILSNWSLPSRVYGIAMNPAETRIYAALYLTNSVAVLDAVTGVQIATIPVGNNPLGISINQAGTKVYVANSGDSTVSVIDTASNTVTNTLTAGSGPFALGRFLGTDGITNNLPTVSLTSPSAGATFQVPVNVPLAANAGDSDGTIGKVEFYQGTTLIGTSQTAPYSIVWNNAQAGSYSLTAKAYDNRGGTTTSSAVSVTVNPPTGPVAYITNSGAGTVSVLDTASNTVFATVSVGTTPYGVAVNPATSRVYVANSDSNTVSVINSATNAVTATINVGAHPVGAAIYSAGNKLYVSNYNANTVSVINTSTNAVSATIPVGAYPYGVATNPAGTRAYVASASSGGISVINTANNTVVTTISGGGSADLLVNAAGTRLYAASGANINVIDTSTNNIIATWALPANGYGIALNAAETRLYVAMYYANSVAVIDTITGLMVGTVSVGTNPLGVSINAAGTKVYVANSGDNTLSVIDTATNTVTATLTAGSNPFALGRFIGADSSANTAPTVNITSPSAGAVFQALSTITLAAQAADSDGTTARVDFYRGTTLICTVEAAPFTCNWSNVPAGSYSLTAKATDNRGASTTSTAVAVSVIVDAAPSVSLTAPANNAVIDAPASITLAATAADSDGTIAKVEFYQGATLVGTATGAPFTASVSGLIAGTYTFTAKATDNQGISTTSSPVSVIVNSPPTVSVSAPTNNAIFNAPASINLTAVAADTDGTIAKVDFYNGSNLIGTVTANPFTYAWTAIPAGNYVITAKATDDRGSTKLSAAVAVTVNAPPTVAITAPLNNAVVVSPGNITLTATASDSDGSIAKVEFYQGPALVGTATAAPYSVSLSGLASGAYTFTANATDDRGAVTVSAPVTILVDAAPTITLTAPAPNTVIAAPGSLTLSANAGDADGTVAKVDFYQGATLVGTVLTPPYSVNVSGLAPGSYSFSAVVTDNFGVTSSSAPVTVIVESAPVVSITAPADGTVVNAPGSIVLTASASDSDGTVSKVDFYNGTTIIGTVTAAPYSVTWANVAAGTYAVSAKATDNQGLSTTSSAVTFIVNAPPTIAITSPVNNSTIAAPANVSITTNAQDSDGTLSKVDYYQGGVLIGTVTAAPYTFNWTNVGQGSYVLTAIATDNYGAQATSGAIAITVAPPAAKVYYVHADHLGTPRAITRPSDNAVVWKWENSDPFGNNAPNEDPSNLGVTTKYNLRFPGQYYDMETGTYYNYFRDYDPLLGRYGQSDPIGLSGGINTYTYVKARPLMLIDPNGLTSVDLNKPAPWTGSCTVAQHSLLQGSVNVACSVARTCKSTQTCRELGSNLFKLQACLKARLLINNTCYAGGDAGHKEAAQNERRGMETCAYWINKKCTTPPNCE